MKLRPTLSLASASGEELFLVYDADAVAHVRAGARRVVALARAAAENGGALPRAARDPGGDGGFASDGGAAASSDGGYESSGSEHEGSVPRVRRAGRGARARARAEACSLELSLFHAPLSRALGDI